MDLYQKLNTKIISDRQHKNAKSYDKVSTNI